MRKVLILLLIILGIGGYLLLKNQTPSSTTNTSIKATTEPINSTFVKEVVAQDNCNNPIGMISYHDLKSDSWMKINNLLLPENEVSKTGLSQIKSFLTMNTLKPLQDINSFEFPFHNYCGGSSNIFIKELPGIIFPNTDKSRVVVNYTTQASFGYVTVVVFAQKNNDIIQLSKFMNDGTLYQVNVNACNTNPTEYQKNEDCYRNRLLQDTNLQNIAANEATRLISLFAIK